MNRGGTGRSGRQDISDHGFELLGGGMSKYHLARASLLVVVSLAVAAWLAADHLLSWPAPERVTATSVARLPAGMPLAEVEALFGRPMDAWGAYDVPDAGVVGDGSWRGFGTAARGRLGACSTGKDGWYPRASRRCRQHRPSTGSAAGWCGRRPGGRRHAQAADKADGLGACCRRRRGARAAHPTRNDHDM
jgi:hypothetical protein